MQQTGTQTRDIWTYRETVRTGGDLSGYHVEATDGSSARSTKRRTRRATSCLVVDTGPWIFGKKVLLPAGIVESVDHDDQKVFVNRTKDEIENAPEYNDAQFTDAKYRGEVGMYYGAPDRDLNDGLAPPAVRLGPAAGGGRETPPPRPPSEAEPERRQHHIEQQYPGGEAAYQSAHRHTGMRR